MSPHDREWGARDAGLGAEDAVCLYTLGRGNNALRRAHPAVHSQLRDR